MMKEIIGQYLQADRAYHAKRGRLERLIRAHHRALERLEHKAPGWYKNVIEPMAEAISKATGLPYKVYGPFGLSSHTSIYFFTDGKIGDICESPTMGITLYPNFWHTEDGTMEFGLQYDTGERRPRYPDGTIGELNDGNVVTAPLPDSLEEILTIMRRREV